jgi:drug/metabolite transporter (DMT)-like permease
MAGAIWATVAAIAFSLSHVALAKGIPPLGVLRATAVLLGTSAVLSAIPALFIEGVAVLSDATLMGVLAFVAAGLIHYGGWGFMDASIERVGPSRMAAISGVAPMFAALLAVATLGESVNLTIGLGIALIVAGTYVIAVS